MRSVLAAVGLSFLLSVAFVACDDVQETRGPSPAASETPASGELSALPEPTAEADGEAQALARARALAKAVGGGLKTRLVAAMGEGGPASAIRVCAEEAQEITRAAIGEGEAAGRASSKLRNPDNAGPPWVRDWLVAHESAPAASAAPFAEVADGRARVIMPIAIEGVCLNCHGAPAAIGEEVRAVLEERYPEDQATGYAEGDLRGALWAEVPVR